jgi:hypothetical protein
MAFAEGEQRNVLTGNDSPPLLTEHHSRKNLIKLKSAKLTLKAATTYQISDERTRYPKSRRLLDLHCQIHLRWTYPDYPHRRLPQALNVIVCKRILLNDIHKQEKTVSRKASIAICLRNAFFSLGFGQL